MENVQNSEWKVLMLQELDLTEGRRNDDLPTTDDRIQLPRSLPKCKKADLLPARPSSTAATGI